MNQNDIIVNGMMTPLEIPEILDQILGYIDNHHVLLACRLVNHSWNQLSTQKLTQKGAALGLNSNNILEYIGFRLRLESNNSNNSTNNAAAKLASLKSLNVKIQYPSASNEEDDDVIHQSQSQELLINYLIQILLAQSIIKIQVVRLCIICPGPSTITVDSRTNTNTNVLELLQLIALTLTQLQLIGNLRFEAPLQNTTPYPNLSSIEAYDQVLTSNAYLSSLINSTSSPKSLSLMTDLNSNDTNQSSHGLTKILRALEPNVWSCLEKLTLSINLVQTLHALCTLQWCNLKALCLHLQITSRRAFDVGSNPPFQVANFPKLTCLELYPMRCDQLLQHFVINLLPVAWPQISTFGFYLSRYSSWIPPTPNVPTRILSEYLIDSCFGQLLAKFPSLDTIKMDVEWLGFLTNYFKSIGGDSSSLEIDYNMPEIFRTMITSFVSTLEIHFSLCFYEEGGPIIVPPKVSQLGGVDRNNIHRTINFLLQKLFPNVTHLILQQNIPIHSIFHDSETLPSIGGFQLPPDVPYNLLKGLLVLNGRLRSLEIKNYVHDWLNEIVSMEEEEEEQAVESQRSVIRSLSELELLSVVGFKQWISGPHKTELKSPPYYNNIKRGGREFDANSFLNKVQVIKQGCQQGFQQ